MNKTFNQFSLFVSTLALLTIGGIIATQAQQEPQMPTMPQSPDPNFTLFVAPNDPAARTATSSLSTDNPSTDILLAENATAVPAQSIQERLSLGIDFQLQGNTLAPLDWLLIEVRITNLSLGLERAQTRGTAPQAKLEYRANNIYDANLQELSDRQGFYRSTTFSLTATDRNDPGPDGNLPLYYTLLHGAAIPSVTLFTLQDGAVAPIFDANNTPISSCDTDPARVPLMQGIDDDSLNVSGTVIDNGQGGQGGQGQRLLTFGPSLISANNNRDFHGDQVFTITARAVCGSKTFAGVALSELMQVIPEHSLNVRMKDDDVPRLWWLPGNPTELTLAENANSVAALNNALRFALVDPSDINVMRPNYSATPLNISVGIEELGAIYGEDVSWTDPHTSTGTRTVVRVIPPDAFYISAAPFILDDNDYEEQSERFAVGFRGTVGAPLAPFRYMPAPPNTEGYSVTTFYEDLLDPAIQSQSMRSIVVNITDNETIEIALETPSNILTPGEDIVLSWRFLDGVRQKDILPQISLLSEALGSAVSLSNVFDTCQNSVFCAIDSEASVQSINTNRYLGQESVSRPIARLRTRSDANLDDFTLRIALRAGTSGQRFQVGPPIVLSGLSQTPVITYILFSSTATAVPVAGDSITAAMHQTEVMEPNPIEDCPDPIYEDSTRPFAEHCARPPVSLRVYAALLATSSTATALDNELRANNFGGPLQLPPLALPDDDDYLWLPSGNPSIPVGEATAHVGTIVLRADDLLERTELIALDRHIQQQPRSARLSAVYYKYLPANLRTLEVLQPGSERFSDIGLGPRITIHDADNYYYTPLIYPVITTIPHEQLSDIRIMFDIARNRHLLATRFSVDLWEAADVEGGAVHDEIIEPIPSDARITLAALTANVVIDFRERNQFDIYSYADINLVYPASTVIGDIDDLIAAGGDFGPNGFFALLDPHPTYVGSIPVRIYRSAEFVNTIISGSSEDLVNSLRNENNYIVRNLSLIASVPSLEISSGITLRNSVGITDIRYRGKPTIQILWDEGGLVNPANPALSTSDTSLVRQIPTALSAGPITTATLTAVPGTTLHYTFRAPQGITLRLSFTIDTGLRRNYDVDGAASRITIPFALHRQGEGGLEHIASALVLAGDSDIFNAFGPGGAASIYMSFTETGTTPAHLDFGSLSCGSDPISHAPVFMGDGGTRSDGLGYYLPVPGPPAPGLQTYVLELGIPQTDTVYASANRPPFMFIDSAIHCLQARDSRYINYHPLKCSDTAEAVADNPPNVCAPKRQLIELDVLQTLTITELAFSNRRLRESAMPNEQEAHIDLYVAQQLRSVAEGNITLNITLTGNDDRLRYDGNPIPSSGILSMAFNTVTENGNTFLRSAAALTMGVDDTTQLPRTLTASVAQPTSPTQTLQGTLELLDSNPNTFGINPQGADATMPRAFSVNATAPTVLRLKLAQPATERTEIQASFTTNFPAMHGGRAVERIFSMRSAGGHTIVSSQRQLNPDNAQMAQRTYSLTTVFTAGQQTLDALQISPSPAWLGASLAGTPIVYSAETITLSAGDNSDLALVSEDRRAETILARSLTLTPTDTLAANSISVPTTIGVNDSGNSTLMEGGRYRYSIAARSGMSFAVSLENMPAHYANAELTWTVSDNFLHQSSHTQRLSENPEDDQTFYLTIAHPALTGNDARASCSGINSDNELLIRPSSDLGLGIFTYSLELSVPEDNGDYYGVGENSQTQLEIVHSIACLSSSFNKAQDIGVLAVPCTHEALQNGKRSCSLADSVEGSTLTLTVNDNDAYITRLEITPAQPYGGYFAMADAPIIHETPAFPNFRAIPPPFTGRTNSPAASVGITAHLPGTNRSNAELTLSLDLVATDSPAERARYMGMPMEQRSVRIDINVPAGASMASDSTNNATISVPDDNRFSVPGTLTITDASVNVPESPLSRTIKVLDLGDSYYQLGASAAGKPFVSPARRTLPISLLLGAPTAQQTTLTFTIELRLNSLESTGATMTLSDLMLSAAERVSIGDVITTEAGDLRYPISVEFAAGQQEARLFDISVADSFYMGASDILLNYVRMILIDPVSEAATMSAMDAAREILSVGILPLDDVRAYDGDRPAVRYDTLISFLNIPGEYIELGVRAAGEQPYLLESAGMSNLFNITARRDGTEVSSYPLAWQTVITLHDEALGFESISVTPDTVATTILSGEVGTTTNTRIMLSVPAGSNISTINILGNPVRGEPHVLQGVRLLDITLDSISDALGFMRIVEDEFAYHAVLDDAPLQVDLSLLLGASSTINEGGRTSLGFILRNTDNPGTAFTVDSYLRESVYIAVLEPNFNYLKDSTAAQDTATYDGICGNTQTLGYDYCLTSLLDDGADIFFTILSPLDPVVNYHLLSANHGTTIDVGVASGAAIGVNAYRDSSALLEGDEALSLGFTTRIELLQMSSTAARGATVGTDITISGTATDITLSDVIPAGQLFYRTSPLTFNEADGETMQNWMVSLVNLDGTVYNNELGRSLEFGMQLAPVETTGHRAIQSTGDISVALATAQSGELLNISFAVTPSGLDDLDAVNEVAVFQLFERTGGTLSDTPIPPHPAQGMGLDNYRLSTNTTTLVPRLRVHYHDDDTPQELLFVRYSRSNSVTSVVGNGLGDAVIQGGAAFVDDIATGLLNAVADNYSFSLSPMNPDAMTIGDTAVQAALDRIAAVSTAPGDANYYIVLALSMGSAGAQSLNYQAIDENRQITDLDAGHLSEIIDWRIAVFNDAVRSEGSTARVYGAPPQPHRGPATNSHLLLITNDANILELNDDVAQVRGALRDACPQLSPMDVNELEDSETLLSISASAPPADGNTARSSAPSFLFVDTRTDGAYYGYREDALTLTATLLCASDPSISPDLYDNLTAEGTRGPEYCADRMDEQGRCIIHTALVNYQNFLRGFHDNAANFTLHTTRAHNDTLIEPDARRVILSSETRTFVDVSIERITTNLHMDYGAGEVAFIPRANHADNSTTLSLELQWDSSIIRASLAAEELALYAAPTIPQIATTPPTDSLRLRLLPRLEGTDSTATLTLDFRVAAKEDNLYEYCYHHNLYADLSADLRYLRADRGDEQLHRDVRYHLCAHPDDPSLSPEVAAELRKRGREPHFRLLGNFNYGASVSNDGTDTTSNGIHLNNNGFAVEDSDSYVTLQVEGSSVLREGSADTTEVYLQFGGTSPLNRFHVPQDLLFPSSVDVAVVISGNAERVGFAIQSLGGGAATIVPDKFISWDFILSPNFSDVLSSTIIANIGYHVAGFTKGRWFDNIPATAGRNYVNHVQLLEQQTTQSVSFNRYNLRTEIDAHPVLGNTISVFRIHGGFPISSDRLRLMTLRTRDDSVIEGTDSFSLHLGILSASSTVLRHAQVTYDNPGVDDSYIDTSLGVGRYYSAALNDLIANNQPALVNIPFTIIDNDVPHVTAPSDEVASLFLEKDPPDYTHPEVSEYTALLAHINASGMRTVPPNTVSGGLFRIDFASQPQPHGLPEGQRYQVSYQHTAPVSFTEAHDVDIRAGASLYLLLGNPDIVQAGGACEGRVANLDSLAKPLIAIGRNPISVNSDILSALPDNGLSARLSFTAFDGGDLDFQGEGAFRYQVHLLCSNKSIFNPGDYSVGDVCPPVPPTANVQADTVDGGASCMVHESSPVVVRDIGHRLALFVTAAQTTLTRSNISDNLVLSIPEPAGARPQIGMPAMRDNFAEAMVTVRLLRVNEREPRMRNNRSNSDISITAPSLETIFTTPFASRLAGAPFTATLSTAAVTIKIGAHSGAWFDYTARDDNVIEGLDQVIEAVSESMNVTATIDSVLDATTVPGFTALTLSNTHGLTLRLLDTDNYYYISSPALGQNGIVLTESHDGSAAAPIVMRFVTTHEDIALSPEILAADPLAGERFAINIESLTLDGEAIPTGHTSATLSDFRLHNIYSLPDDASTAIMEDQITELDNIELFEEQGSTGFFAAGTRAYPPFNLGASIGAPNAGLLDLTLFDLSAINDDEAAEGTESLNLSFTVNFLARPNPNGNYLLRQVADAQLERVRTAAGLPSVGTALPVTIATQARSVYAKVLLNRDSLVTTRYLVDEVPPLAQLSFTELSLPSAPIVLRVELMRDSVFSNSFFDGARLGLARRDAEVPTTTNSTYLRTCTTEDCTARSNFFYLQLGPYSGDDNVVLQAVGPDHALAQRRAQCARDDAPYFIANVLRNPRADHVGPTHNDNDPRYQLEDDGRTIRLVLSDDGISAGETPMIGGAPETIFRRHFGRSVWRYELLCADDGDYSSPGVLPICTQRDINACATQQDAQLFVRGVSYVHRFALQRNDLSPLFISDPVLYLHEPDVPSGAPVSGQLTQVGAHRNQPSLGSELALYVTLASGPTGETGATNLLRPDPSFASNFDGTTDEALSVLGLRNDAAPEFYARYFCLPMGAAEPENLGASANAADSVVGDCTLNNVTANDQSFLSGNTLYVAQFNVLADNRWEPITDNTNSSISYAGQRGYYIEGSDLLASAGLEGHHRIDWLANNASTLNNQDILGETVTIAQPPVTTYPDKIYIRDAESTISIRQQNRVIDFNANTSIPDRARMRLVIGTDAANRLPLGLPAATTGSGITLDLPSLAPTCSVLRRPVLGTENIRYPLALNIGKRSSEDSLSEAQNFIVEGDARDDFGIAIDSALQNLVPCVTPSLRNSFMLLPTIELSTELSENNLGLDFFLRTISPEAIQNLDGVIDYRLSLASSANSLYRLYDNPQGEPHPMFPRRVDIRIGDDIPPILCGDYIEGTQRLGTEISGAEPTCLRARALNTLVVETTWTIAVDYKVHSPPGAELATDIYYQLDGGLPTAISAPGTQSVDVTSLSQNSPYTLHYYAAAENSADCEPFNLGGPLPDLYANGTRVPVPLDMVGNAPTRHLLRLVDQSALRAGRKHCIVLEVSDGIHTAHSKPASFTMPVYRPDVDANNNGIPDDAEIDGSIPDNTPITTAANAFLTSFCAQAALAGGTPFDPSLGPRNDCDGDGMPDLAEMAFAPSPDLVIQQNQVGMAQFRQISVTVLLCHANELRTRFPLSSQNELLCRGDGADSDASLIAAINDNWRMLISNEQYRGVSAMLGAEQANNPASGISGDGLLPGNYWLVNVEQERMLNLLLLPYAKLTAPPRVPVYTRYQYVGSGVTAHPDDPSLTRGIPVAGLATSHRGESYFGTIAGVATDTNFYAVRAHNLDFVTATSVPHSLALKLIGVSNIMRDIAGLALSYQVSIDNNLKTPPNVLTDNNRLLLTTVENSTSSLITDIEIPRRGAIEYTLGFNRIMLSFTAEYFGVTVARNFAATVEGVFADAADINPRLVSIGAPTSGENPFPLNYPVELEPTLSSNFFTNAQSSLDAPITYFTPPTDPNNNSDTVFTLDLDLPRLRGLDQSVISWQLLNYATGASTNLASRTITVDGANNVDAAIDINSAELCAALGGCDFSGNNFYLFQLVGTLSAYIYTEEEAILPPGTYTRTHNTGGIGTIVEDSTVSDPLTVIYEKRSATPMVIARIAQMAQLGGTMPNNPAAGGYVDNNYDGVPDTIRDNEADITRLFYSVARPSDTSPSYGYLSTNLRFARIHLGAYGRGGYQRDPLPRNSGANIGALADTSGNLPVYPRSSEASLANLALDFFITCDARAQIGAMRSVNGAAIAPMGSQTIDSIDVDQNCLGKVTPVLITLPPGAITEDILPAQIVTISTASGFATAPTQLCDYIVDRAIISEQTMRERAARGCPPIVLDGNSADTAGDSFAFASLGSRNTCPDLSDESSWTRRNMPALGGERCLRLLISDNGPNDMAPAPNVIADPLVFVGGAITTSTTTVPTTTPTITPPATTPPATTPPATTPTDTTTPPNTGGPGDGGDSMGGDSMSGGGPTTPTDTITPPNTGDPSDNNPPDNNPDSNPNQNPTPTTTPTDTITPPNTGDPGDNNNGDPSDNNNGDNNGDPNNQNGNTGDPNNQNGNNDGNNGGNNQDNNDNSGNDANSGNNDNSGNGDTNDNNEASPSRSGGGGGGGSSDLILIFLLLALMQVTAKHKPEQQVMWKLDRP